MATAPACPSIPWSSVRHSRQALLASIKGRTITIPNLKPIFNDWKGIESRHVGSWLDPLRDKVRNRLASLDFDQDKRRKLEAADFALFTALWWPDTPSLAQAEILAYLVIWLFTWDDEIDEPTGSYTDDEKSAKIYRNQTLNFIGKCLGLIVLPEPSLRPSNRIVQSFDVIGDALSASYNIHQRQFFLDEIARFMAGSEVEQVCRLQDKIFTLQEYWPVRMGTSAVYIGSAVGEFSMGGSPPLPPEVMKSGDMQALWDETNFIISITNDLLSLRKEIKMGCIDSVIPLTFALTRDVQKAVDQSVAALAASKERFEDAARKLISDDSPHTEVDPKTREQIVHFIEVQRSNCVGNLIWSLETWRYNPTNLVASDGSQTFDL